MARLGEGMVLIVLAVLVGDLHSRFENGRVRGHEVMVPVIVEGFRYLRPRTFVHMSL